MEDLPEKLEIGKKWGKNWKIGKFGKFWEKIGK